MKKQAFNPYLPSYEYVPDGEAHVFGDRVYLYGSHDRFDSAGFCLNDYVCYSAPVTDLSDWKYEGVIYKKTQDPRNQNIPQNAPEQTLLFGIKPKKEEDLNPRGIHAMWAPDVVKGLDGKFYLYYCLDFTPQIGVAVCDTPAGKYEFLGLVKHEDGTPLGSAPKDLVQFDPGVFIDDDIIYLFSGNAALEEGENSDKYASQVMQLKPDMLTLKTEPKKLLPGVLSPNKDGFEGHEFFEASSIRKFGGKYYFVYSSVNSSELCYAISDKPDEGYKYGGTLVDIGDIGLNGRTRDNAVNALGNTHGCLELINDSLYVFYHRQTNRTNYSRQGCAEKIVMDENGKIAQTEVTSCGLNGKPLDGSGTYPAYICCHLTGKKGAAFSHPDVMKMDYPFLTQDLPDISPDDPRTEKEKNSPVQYIRNISDKTVIGYKYFSFEGDSRIKFRLRGKAEGTIFVQLSEKGSVCGEIPLKIQSEEWNETEGEFYVEKGVYPIYFRFLGKGSFDFSEFVNSQSKFHSRKRVEFTEKNRQNLK